MAETQPTTRKLHRDAFYKDALRFTIYDNLKQLPQKFTITEIVEHMNQLADKPFTPYEMPAFYERTKRAMKTWRKAGKLTIGHQATENNNYLTNYTQTTTTA